MDLPEPHVDNIYQHPRDEISDLTAHLNGDEISQQFTFNCQSGRDVADMQHTLFNSRSFYNESKSEDECYFSYLQYLGTRGMGGINTCGLNGHANWNTGTAVQCNLPTVDIDLKDLYEPTIEYFPKLNHPSNFATYEIWNPAASTDAYDASITPNWELIVADIVSDATSAPADSCSSSTLTSSCADHSETHTVVEGRMKLANEARKNGANSYERSERGKELNGLKQKIEVCVPDIDIRDDEQVYPKRAKMNDFKRSQPDSIWSAEEHQITWIPYTPFIEYNFIPAPIPANYRVKFMAVETVCTPAHLGPQRPRRAARCRS
ncbi:hypothetical protein BDZ91DRAFT_797821 [Kalaharituber pfeilii]|nr:hypothetical protein BDZ91DRAFT_797821 [Kalaharituber pfeilii]